MNDLNNVKFVMVPFEGKQISVPEGGLVDFFVSQGHEIFSVVDSTIQGNFSTAERGEP